MHGTLRWARFVSLLWNLLRANHLLVHGITHREGRGAESTHWGGRKRGAESTTDVVVKHPSVVLRGHNATIGCESTHRWCCESTHRWCCDSTHPSGCESTHRSGCESTHRSSCENTHQWSGTQLFSVLPNRSVHRTYQRFHLKNQDYVVDFMRR